MFQKQKLRFYFNTRHVPSGVRTVFSRGRGAALCSAAAAAGRRNCVRLGMVATEVPYTKQNKSTAEYH